MILTDGIHVASDFSAVELHMFAAKAGIKRCWYHHSRNHPHYDKPKKFPVEKLIEAGAKKVSSRTLVQRCVGCNCFKCRERRGT